MRRPISQGLLAVAVLGVVTSGLGVIALDRAVTASHSLRLSHARESTAEELGRLGASPPDAEAPPPNIIGMRGDISGTPAEIAKRVPPAWGPSLVVLAGRALAENTAVYDEAPLAGARLVERAAPAPGGRIAWVAYKVAPSPYLQSWRMLVVALTISALLLVASAVTSLVGFKRGASQLLGATRALASDLSAPVPRPPVAELADIGDGIAALARNLTESRQAQERLARDLARQERLAALGRVVAGVAHEVRNPLASIKLRLDLAGSPPASGGAAPLPPAVAGAIAHASAEITRLDGLVADLLTVSGRALGPRAPLDVAQLARRRADALAPWAALRGVTMHVSDRSPGTAVATGDADRLANRSTYASSIAVPGSRRLKRASCSSRSSPPRRTGRAWAWRSRARSPRHTAARSPTGATAPSRASSSPCRARGTPSRGAPPPERTLEPGAHRRGRGGASPGARRRHRGDGPRARARAGLERGAPRPRSRHGGGPWTCTGRLPLARHPPA
jgi:signal transduction histidine kinase